MKAQWTSRATELNSELGSFSLFDYFSQLQSSGAERGKP